MWEREKYWYQMKKRRNSYKYLGVMAGVGESKIKGARSHGKPCNTNFVTCAQFNQSPVNTFSSDHSNITCMWFGKQGRRLLKHCEKKTVSGFQHFLLSLQCFLHLHVSSTNLIILAKSVICKSFKSSFISTQKEIKS